MPIIPIMTSEVKQTKAPGRINQQTLLFFLHNFFINAGTILVYVSANVLLLENHPEYSLPIAYIVAAIAVMIAGKIYEHFEHHLLLKKLSLGTMLATLFMVVVVMGLLMVGHGVATAIAIMVGYRIIYLLINLEFWGLSALVFNVRQSKRLFSVIGSGDTPAKSLGAVLAVLIHSPSILMILLIISLLFFALSLYTQILTFKYTDIPNPHHARERSQSDVAPAFIQKYFSGNKLLTSLCLGMMAISATATWIEYHFFVNVKYKFHSQHEVILFVGSLLTATYLIATIVKVLFSGKTVEKFGIKLTARLLPLVTVITSLGLLISSLFRHDDPSLLVYYCISYFLFEIVRRTIFDPVFLVLFQPLSTKMRLKGHTLAKGLYEPLGMMIAGILLYIIYTMKWSNVSITMDLSLLFALSALFLLGKAYKHYKEELRNAIGKRFIRSIDIASTAEVLPIIQENIISGKKEEVINAIDWISRYKPNLFPNYIYQLLNHESVAVRFKTLDTLQRSGQTNFKPEFYEYIERESDSKCQTLAVTIASSTGQMTEAKISNFLYHTDPDIVKGALLGLHHSGKNQTLFNNQILRLFNTSGQSELTALEIVADLKLSGYQDQVLKKLNNPDILVRKKAIAAISRSGNSDLLMHLKPLLKSDVSRQVLESVAASDTDVSSLLSDWISTQSQEKDIIHLARANEKSGNVSIQTILYKHLKSIYLNIHIENNINIERYNISIRNHILKSLTNSRLRIDTSDELLQFIGMELVLAGRIMNGMDEKTEGDSWNKSLAFELEAIKLRLYYLFALLYDKEALQNAWKGIRHHSSEKRANSLELIESLIPRNLYQSLHALFEDITIQRRKELLKLYNEEAATETELYPFILNQKEYLFSNWTIALALQKAGRDNILVGQLVTHPTTLISETAKSILNLNQKFNSHSTLMHTEHNNAQVSEMERIIVLKNTQLFAETPENVLSSIAPIMREVSFQEGEEIFAKGDLGDSMYIIYAGNVGIYDQTKQLALFDKGEIFGELALLDTEPRSATTVAETDIMLFRIDQEDFFELMEERDEILRNVLRILCQRIRVQNEKMRKGN